MCLQLLMVDQEWEGTNSVEGTFPQWLTGLIATTVFLFLVLAVYVVKRFWKGRSIDNRNLKSLDAEEVVANGSHGHYTTTIENFRSSEHVHAYDNPSEVKDDIRTTAM
ncbi:hypothetical protein GDO86_007868 [Hymenochirus boettgeri]|uniref:PDZK1-interacting protein 1 n=1 Tax=Hymenochirus boettgeri TaxID=247094 RepID=A0A8T2J3I1_9PIPI|nr:hypothetical protein GDO86_007868 [Hymenochirus boettgeri]